MGRRVASRMPYAALRNAIEKQPFDDLRRCGCDLIPFKNAARGKSGSGSPSSLRVRKELARGVLPKSKTFVNSPLPQTRQSVRWKKFLFTPLDISIKFRTYAIPENIVNNPKIPKGRRKCLTGFMQFLPAPYHRTIKKRKIKGTPAGDPWISKLSWRGIWRDSNPLPPRRWHNFYLHQDTFSCRVRSGQDPRATG